MHKKMLQLGLFILGIYVFSAYATINARYIVKNMTSSSIQLFWTEGSPDYGIPGLHSPLTIEAGKEGVFDATYSYSRTSFDILIKPQGSQMIGAILTLATDVASACLVRAKYQSFYALMSGSAWDGPCQPSPFVMLVKETKAS